MLSIVSKKQSSDGTIKYALHDGAGNHCEAVYFTFHDAKDKDRPLFESYRHNGVLPKYSICLSSQAGCAMRCGFCATGTLGFKKNLSSQEMHDQVQLIRSDLIPSGIEREETLFNIIMMGMGEPLMNIDNVLSFTESIPDVYPSALPLMSISTVGIIPKIQKLIDFQGLRMKLFLSVHAPSDEERSAIMPINRTYPLQDVLKACENFAHVKNEKVVACYLLLHGVNDSPSHAKAFSKLLNPSYFETQILVYNTIPQLPYQRPSMDTVITFADIVKASGLATDIRISKGQDIQGGCGQLIRECSND